ncbi:hypothetical protein [Nakamurella deserti]|uniref:hypothetical protein n=1 Tax=Nakamurella deserti TaxID=2164074 RepID=UPI000DBE906B|nr:hypothetical protein [Nakamurella deserti]
MRTSRVILPLLLAAVLAGCGGNAPATPTGGSGTPGGPTPATSTVAGGPSSTGPATPSGPAPGSTAPVPTPGTEIEDPTLSPPAVGTAAAVTVTGVPTAGVEANCWLLDGYLLVGGPVELIASGQRLTVTGRPEPDLMTTCQQGAPLRVTSATAA